MKHISGRTVRDSLTIACCSLLQTSPDTKAELLEDIDIDTAVLIYSESDGRVSILEPVIKLRSELDEDEFLSLQLVFDSLTGASPNGAHPSSALQTFTSPSGRQTYNTQPGELPLDDYFRDSRLSTTLSYEQAIDRVTKNTWSGNFSKEFDWLSLNGGYSWSRDYNQRNTTLTLSGGLTSDTIDPIGGAPDPLALMAPPGTPQPKSGSENRTTVDLMLGLTQVLGKKTITQLNLGLSQSDGYHTDPFKIVSVIDDNPLSATYGLPEPSLNTATSYPYRFESRPDSRQRTTLYWKIVHQLNDDVINFSYRYYTDDWGIDSHTTDLKYRIRLSERDYLQPHLRFYSQSAADFYRHSLLASETLPDYVSTDSRLAEFTTLTYGIKYGHILGKNNEISGRIEWMQQTGDSSPDDAIGDQLNQDLYPDLEAIIVQLSYSFIW